MSTIQLKTKEDIKSFIATLGKSKNEQVVVEKDQKGNIYYKIPDSYIDGSMNATFHNVLDDYNLEAVVVRNFYVIFHENLVETITGHLHEKFSIKPIRFCDMMKEAAVA